MLEYIHIIYINISGPPIKDTKSFLKCVNSIHYPLRSNWHPLEGADDNIESPREQWEGESL